MKRHVSPLTHLPRRAICVLGLLAALTAVGEAAASGGTTIRGGPTIRPGVAQATNTATEATVPGTSGSEKTGCWKSFQYWNLPLTIGDAVEIRGVAGEGASNFQVGVFPVGTTDANIRGTAAIATALVPNSGPLRFRASATGTYPVVAGPNCYHGNDGSFSFTVTVNHHAVSQPVVVTLARRAEVRTSDAITATVRTDTGAAIGDPALVLKLYGTWKESLSEAPTRHLLATASPKKGSARLAFRLPADLRGTTVELQVKGGGGSYSSVKSRCSR